MRRQRRRRHGGLRGRQHRRQRRPHAELCRRLQADRPEPDRPEGNVADGKPGKRDQSRASWRAVGHAGTIPGWRRRSSELATLGNKPVAP